MSCTIRWPRPAIFVVTGEPQRPFLNAGMKLLFVAPLVSRRYTSNWEGVATALRATLASLSRQRSSAWRLMVVGSELPDVGRENRKKVTFVACDPDIDEPTRRGRREIDKQRKLYAGFVAAHRLAPDYIMPLDYDDLVSIRLVQHVADHPHADAFLLKAGYVYHEGDTLCQYSRRLYMRTGSNLVVRFRHDLFPTKPTDFAPPPPDYLEWPFVRSHVKDPLLLFRSLGLQAEIVPCPCVVWRRSSRSISLAYSQTVSSAARNGILATARNSACGMRDYLKRVVLSRKIDPRIALEFGCDPGTFLGLPRSSAATPPASSGSPPPATVRR